MSKLKASEEFVVGKQSIGWVDSDFTKAFSKEKFDVSNKPTFQTLTKRMTDAEIESELKPGISTLGDVLAFLQNPPEGSKDGYYNIFYFPAFVVGVYWNSGSGSWDVSAWRRGDDDWRAGTRVFSPATVHSAPVTSEPKIEIWKSNENREERHYFIEGGNKGYQNNTYLFGYNPELISEEVAEILLAIVKSKL